jgi:hypothetical protein
LKQIGPVHVDLRWIAQVASTVFTDFRMLDQYYYSSI